MNVKPNLLLLDDEERILRSLKMLFRLGYNVTCCTQGSQALEILRREKMHVVVSDQRMPSMTGVEFLKHARAISPHTMRLLLTGYSDFEAVIDSVNEGEVFRFISKPWDSQKLKETVDKAASIAVETESAYESAQSSALAEPGPEALNVLLLDSEQRTYHAMETISSKNINLFWARTLEEALEILGSKEVSILVSELKLNGQDISGVIKSLKQQTPGLLAIIVTSFSDVSSLIELINQGQVYRYLPKPVSDGMLRRTIDVTVDRYHQLRLKPKLLERYAVEQIRNPNEITLTGKLKHYLDRIRSRGSSEAMSA